MLYTYFRRSLGTSCTTFKKLLTVSARFAFLVTPQKTNTSVYKRLFYCAQSEQDKYS